MQCPNTPECPMPIHIKLSTTLRQSVPGYDPVAGITLPLEEPAPATEVAQRLGLPLQDIKLVMINGRQASLDATIAPNDQIAFFPPVGGG